MICEHVMPAREARLNNKNATEKSKSQGNSSAWATAERVESVSKAAIVYKRKIMNMSSGEPPHRVAVTFAEASWSTARVGMSARHVPRVTGLRQATRSSTTPHSASTAR